MMAEVLTIYLLFLPWDRFGGIAPRPIILARMCDQMSESSQVRPLPSAQERCMALARKGANWARAEKT